MNTPRNFISPAPALKIIALAICEEHRVWPARMIGRGFKRLFGVAGHAPSGNNTVAVLALRALIAAELRNAGVAHTEVATFGPFNRSSYVVEVSGLAHGLAALGIAARTLAVPFAIGVYDQADGLFRTTQGALFAKDLCERLTPESRKRSGQQRARDLKKLKRAQRWLRAFHAKLPGPKPALPPAQPEA